MIAIGGSIDSVDTYKYAIGDEYQCYLIFIRKNGIKALTIGCFSMLHAYCVVAIFPLHWAQSVFSNHAPPYLLCSRVVQDLIIALLAVTSQPPMYYQLLGTLEYE